jgi:ribosomal protein S12 methylthiotransferase
LIEILEQQRLVKNRKYIGKKMTVMIEGRSDETDLLLQGRLPIQAQDIDGHVLINEIDDREHGDRLVLFPGDMVEVEITDAHSMDLVGTVRGLISRSPISEELGSVETVRMHAQ